LPNAGNKNHAGGVLPLSGGLSMPGVRSTKREISIMPVLKFLRPTLVGAFALMSMAAFAQAPVTTVSTDIGDVIADEEGFVLYTFRNDEPGVSNCYDTCAANWPPFFAEEGAMEEGDYTLVTRNDGTVQWAKDGLPLYYWVNDVEPGDTTGDGVGGNWDVARP
jgi:predicted lipoprotein with Yx(FWY)xxD motif